MLNKSILLNLHIAKNDMGALFGVCVTCLVLTLMGLGGMFFLWLLLLPVLLVCNIIFYVRIVNKVFFRSFFDEEGTMYMTLPVSAKDMVLGKILAVTGYMTFIQIVLLGGMITALAVFGEDVTGLVSTLAEDFLLTKGTPAEMAVFLGILPLSIFLTTLFSSSFLLTVFLKMGMRKTKLLVCWIIYGVTYTALTFVLGQAGKLFEGISFGTAIDSCLGSAVYLVISVVLIRYCVKQLEEKYSV